MASLLAAAVVISRGNAETLEKTLSQLAEQTHPLQQVVVVEGSESIECQELAKSFGFAVVNVPEGNLPEQLNAGVNALQGNSNWLWILHHDSAPEPKALEYLAQAAEISPSVAIIGPKQLDWNHPIQIRQLGLTTTKTARPFTLVEDEFDQGQFDAKGDTMAVSTAGMLVAMGLWQKLGGLNPETPSYAQDIEFCISARALGYRVIVEPKARLLTLGSLTSELKPRRKLFGGRAEALSKAHVHLATILWPAWLLPFLYLAMPVVVALSIPYNLLQKRPARIAGQLTAWLYSWFTLSKRLRARKTVRGLGSLASLEKLYATREQLSLRRARKFEEEPEPESRSKGLLESGGLWFSFIPVLAGYTMFPQGALSRDGLVPLGRTFDAIWSKVAAITQGYLDGVSLPSDPFNWFLALLALIWPASPNAALAWFLFVSPALFYIAVWLLLGLVTKKPIVKNIAALLIASSLPIALLQREAGVVELTAIVFASYSGFFLAKSALAFNLARAWRWLGLAGLTGAVVAVSAPVLFGLLVLLAVALGLYRIRRLGVLVWFGLPGLGLLAPWLAFGLEAGNLSFLSTGSSAALSAFDFYQDPLWFITLLSIAVLALVGGILRPTIGLPLWVFALVLLFASSVQPLAGSYALFVAVLVTLGLVAVSAIEELGARWVVAATSLIGIMAGASLVVGFQQPVQFGFVPDRQVPALVMAASDVDPATRTLSITELEDGFAAELIWGDGRNQEEVALTYDYLKPQSALEPQLAQLAASLIAGNPDGVQELLDFTGIDFVLLSGSVNPRVQIALDSLTLLQPSGQTSFGLLWRVVEPNQTPRFDPSYFSQRDLQLGLIAAFTLLAIPTPGSITGRRLRRSA